MMSNVGRGVLKSGICLSLTETFMRFMDLKTPEQEQAWNEFLKDGSKFSAFMKVYRDIFRQVSKWSKKDKHKEACLDLLWKMEVHCNQYEFYAEDSEDVFGHLCKGLSKSEFRLFSMKVESSLPCASELDIVTHPQIRPF